MPRYEFQPGVPLGQLLGQANVLLCCKKCMWRETYDLGAVIERLIARRVNGPLIGICAAAAHVRMNCPQCNQRSWETRPDYIKNFPLGIPDRRSH